MRKTGVGPVTIAAMFAAFLMTHWIPMGAHAQAASSWVIEAVNGPDDDDPGFYSTTGKLADAKRFASKAECVAFMSNDQDFLSDTFEYQTAMGHLGLKAVVVTSGAAPDDADVVIQCAPAPAELGQ